MFWGREDAPEYWQTVVDRFRAAGNENVTVEFIHQPMEYEVKLNTLIAANETPDVVLLAGQNVLGYVEDGLILDQKPYFDEIGTDPYEFYVPAAVREIDGQIACIASGLHTMMMYYNKSAFDAAGVPYPPSTQEEAWTWDEFVAAAKALTSGEGVDKTYGIYIPPWPTIWRVFVDSNNGSYYNDDWTRVTLDTPEAAEVFQKLADLRLVDQVAPTLDQIDTFGWDIFLQGNRAAMFIDGTFDMEYMIEWWGDDLGVAPLPKFKEYVTHPIADCPVVFNNTEHPDEAFAFARFLSDPSNWIEDYKVGKAIPVAQEYLFGDGAAEWLNSEILPDGYEFAVVENLKYAGTNPELVQPDHAKIEWPAIMPHVYNVLRGDGTAEAEMKLATEEANAILIEEQSQ